MEIDPRGGGRWVRPHLADPAVAVAADSVHAALRCGSDRGTCHARCSRESTNMLYSTSRFSLLRRRDAPPAAPARSLRPRPDVADDSTGLHGHMLHRRDSNLWEQGSQLTLRSADHLPWCGPSRIASAPPPLHRTVRRLAPAPACACPPRRRLYELTPCYILGIHIAQLRDLLAYIPEAGIAGGIASVCYDSICSVDCYASVRPSRSSSPPRPLPLCRMQRGERSSR